MEYQCQFCDQSCDNDLNHSIEVPYSHRLPGNPSDSNHGPPSDRKSLSESFKMAIANLDHVIDINYYPVPQTKKFDPINRPIGIGVENLQDVFILMDWPFKQEEIKEDNHS